MSIFVKRGDTLKKFLSVFIALILLLFFTLPLCSAYQTIDYRMSAENLTLYSYHSGAYFLNFHGSECHVEKLSPNTYGADLQLNHSIKTAEVVSDDIAVMLCNDINNDQTIIYTYYVDRDILDSFSIAEKQFVADCGIGSDGNSVFLVPYSHTNMIEEYSFSGRLLNSYSFEREIKQLGADNVGDVFAINSGNLYRLDSGRFRSVGSGVSAPVTLCGGGLMTDAVGRVFDIRDGCRLIFTTGGAVGRQNSCCINDVLYRADGMMIYGYDTGSGERIAEIKLDSDIMGLYSSNGYVCAVCMDGEPSISRIHPDEFTDLRAANNPQDDTPDIGYHGNSAAGRITSSVYRVDYNAYSISGIESGTTLAQFKKNISYDGYRVSFYRDGIQKTSGKCGTAMLAVFDSDDARYTFELSVIGDITGEGNVNSRDLSLFMEYLIGTADFNGVYVTSADLSDDGKLDVKDLAMMHRMY